MRRARSKHRAAQRCEFVFFAHTVHQRAAQVFLQRLDASAQGRLGDVQFFSRTAEGAGVSQRQPVFKVPEVHAFILRMIIRKISHWTH
jgi:hypothetical protein